MAPGLIVFVRHAGRSDHRATGRIAVLQDGPRSANMPDPASVHQHPARWQAGAKSDGTDGNMQGIHIHHAVIGGNFGS
jgi:hypothetical protein